MNIFYFNVSEYMQVFSNSFKRIRKHIPLVHDLIIQLSYMTIVIIDIFF